MKRICLVTAVPATVNAFLKEHILVLSKHYDVSVITNLSGGVSVDVPIDVNVFTVNIVRDISLFKDIKSLFSLRSIFASEKFDLVLSVTPKAGLLSALAGCMSGQKNRLHWFTGQVWVTQTGLKRGLLKSVDKLLAACVSDALVDSQSQFSFLISENLLKQSKGQVLGAGSICGVNLNRFKFDLDSRRAFRKKINLNEDDKVLLFLGRLNRDKGILDLVEAFHKVIQQTTGLHLVLVGPDEQNIQSTLFDSNRLHPNIHFTGGTSEPEKWLSIADVFCLPSYREGFGSSVIEAAAVGLPAITSRIYGLTDAVVEGETGLMHEVKNIDEIADAIIKIMADDVLRLSLGNNARKRAQESFSQQYVSQLLLDYIDFKLK